MNSYHNKENHLQQGKTVKHSALRAFGSDLTNNQMAPAPQLCEDSLYLDSLAPEIFEYLHGAQTQTSPSVGGLYWQSEITENMRAVLIDWLVEVHLKFKLTPETLYLTVNLLDRYIEKRQVTKGSLQLLGVAAMLLAAKYEEIYPPEVKDFVYITDSTYTYEQVLGMENVLIRALDFNLTICSAYRFLERYSRLMGYSAEMFHMAQYFLEICMLHYQMLTYIPSVQAGAAVYLTNLVFNIKPFWPAALECAGQMNAECLRPCYTDMCVVLQGSEGLSLQGTFKKFSKEDFSMVAKVNVIGILANKVTE